MSPDLLHWQGWPDGATTGEFPVGERRFTVEIVPRRGPHSYTAGFYDEDSRITLTGRGDAHRVIARGLAALEAFIGIYDPEEVWFHALRSEPSRVKLYRSLVGRVNRGRLFAGYRGEVVEDAKQIGFRIFLDRD